MNHGKALLYTLMHDASVHAVFDSANFERSDARNFTKILLLLGFIDAISINCAIVNIVSFLHLYSNHQNIIWLQNRKLLWIAFSGCGAEN